MPSGRADQGIPACHLPRSVNQMLKMQVKSTWPPPAAVRQAGALSPGPSKEKISLPIFISLFQPFVCRSVQYSLLLQLLSPDFPDYCSQGHIDWDLLSLTLTSAQAPGLETLFLQMESTFRSWSLDHWTASCLHVFQSPCHCPGLHSLPSCLPRLLANFLTSPLSLISPPPTPHLNSSSTLLPEWAF